MIFPVLGKTPIRKNESTNTGKVGKTPMKKNITILDKLGNRIGTTYPKRAKGLVKSGRAYTVDGETVQLICPPKKYMQKCQEDINMDIETKKE